MMMVATSRDERRLLSKALHQLKAENTTIKSQSALEIGDFEVHMSDSNVIADSARGKMLLRTGSRSCSDRH